MSTRKQVSEKSPELSFLRLETTNPMRSERDQACELEGLVPDDANRKATPHMGLHDDCH